MAFPPSKASKRNFVEQQPNSFTVSNFEKSADQLPYNSNLEKIYEEIENEITGGNVLKGLWAKCLVDANQDQNTAKTNYFKLRLLQRLTELKAKDDARIQAALEVERIKETALEAIRKEEEAAKIRQEEADAIARRVTDKQDVMRAKKIMFKLYAGFVAFVFVVFIVIFALSRLTEADW
ncbi:hypothetical protein [Falsihalocynthiibacter arcticus]|uniref:Uncharacterized protein n=1 Tax=Falsihalocynthiibacter arcticus TaxID=1579316 RepID=A0A126UZK1_9RHOB|nr:hypothetical protein [Falsihalocynthiibacter arcticus]AML51470.1 hypothetical protein RC74_09560 [Falsihalocynthiibacter arcticus]